MIFFRLFLKIHLVTITVNLPVTEFHKELLVVIKLILLNFRFQRHYLSQGSHPVQ